MAHRLAPVVTAGAAFRAPFLSFLRVFPPCWGIHTLVLQCSAYLAGVKARGERFQGFRGSFRGCLAMRPCLEVSRGDVVRRRGRYGFRWRYIEAC